MLIVLYVLMCISARVGADVPDAQAQGFRAFWQQALVQLQGWPAQPQWRGNELTFAGPGMIPCRVRVSSAGLEGRPSEGPAISRPAVGNSDGQVTGDTNDGPADGEPASAARPLHPILYLLDRAEPESFQPGDTHVWMILDVQADWSGPQPMRRAVQLAQRALEMLLAWGGHTPQLGLAGEGRGAAVALALAALSPQRVAFVAAHEPVGEEAPCADLTECARHVSCPVLMSLGGRDTVAPPEQVLSLYHELNCMKELAEFPRAGHCQPQDLQAWSEVWREWSNRLLLGGTHM